MKEQPYNCNTLRIYVEEKLLVSDVENLDFRGDVTLMKGNFHLYEARNLVRGSKFLLKLSGFKLNINPTYFLIAIVITLSSHTGS